MNERIKQFALQAGNYVNETYTGPVPATFLGNPEWHKEFDKWTQFSEKFAELIVQECIAHGKLTQSQTVVNGSEEYNSGREMGIEVFMNQIKQHFGVKE